MTPFDHGPARRDSKAMNITATDSNQHDHPKGEYLTIAETARRLGACRATVYKLIKQNAFPVYRPVGDRIRIKAAELETYIQSTRE